jgi:hypothetical protein
MTLSSSISLTNADRPSPLTSKPFGNFPIGIFRSKARRFVSETIT